MNQADETQANLAFVALRQEPFLVEEFDYLANQIQDLHEVRIELEARYKTDLNPPTILEPPEKYI